MNTTFKSIFTTLFLLASPFVQAQVGIGTSTPDASAKLEVLSTTKGFLPPRMTTAERDAIGSPATGLVIFNTNTNGLEVRTSSAWVKLVVPTDNVANVTGTIAIANGGTGSSTQNFVDLTTSQTINGTKQFQKAPSNAAAFNAANSTSIDFSQSNLAYTSAGGTAPAYTLHNLKDGGAYTLALTSTSNSGVAAFTASGFTVKYMGTVSMTAGKNHIFSFLFL
jgi:hypothetical protein